MLTVLALIAFIGFSILCLPDRAYACVCSPRGENEREDAALAFAEAAVVFEGEITAARTQGTDVIIQFKVTRAYKGIDGGSIEVIESWAYSDCGFGLPPTGVTYFIYGFKAKDGKFYIGSCRSLWGGPDLRYARGEPPTEDDLVPFDEKLRLHAHPSLATQGATLRGKVASLNPLGTANAYVTVWETDEKGRRENLIAARQKVHPDGSFQIRFLPPGTYFVTAVDYRPTPEGRGVGEHGKVSLAEKQSLTISPIRLKPQPLGNIVVHVVAPPSLHDRIFVWLRDVELDKMEGKRRIYPDARTSDLDQESVARFVEMPYGLYEVGVHLTGEDTSKPSWTHDKAQIGLLADSAGYYYYSKNG